MGGLVDTLKSPTVLIGIAAAAAGIFLLRKKGK
jgi:LPXTG-motif cell wall-anchored protein